MSISDEHEPIQYVKCTLIEFKIHGKIHYSINIDNTGLFMTVKQPKTVLGKIKDNQIPFKRIFESDCPVQKYYHENEVEKKIPIFTKESLLGKEISI